MGCSGIFHHSSGFEGSFSKVDPLISFSFFGILWDSLGLFRDPLGFLKDSLGFFQVILVILKGSSGILFHRFLSVQFGIFQGSLGILRDFIKFF